MNSKPKENTAKPSLDDTSKEEFSANENHPVRRLFIFQVKLAVDALRDILLSPISLIATVIDLIEGRTGKTSYFEILMKMGRKSEEKINLFEQYQGRGKTVDSVLKQVEDVLVREYKDGSISEKTKKTIEGKLNIKSKPLDD